MIWSVCGVVLAWPFFSLHLFITRSLQACLWISDCILYSHVILWWPTWQQYNFQSSSEKNIGVYWEGSEYRRWSAEHCSECAGGKERKLSSMKCGREREPGRKGKLSLCAGHVSEVSTLVHVFSSSDWVRERWSRTLLCQQFLLQSI